MTDFGPFLVAVRRRGWWPSVTSWLRTVEHNESVGGVHNSKHLTGDAIDVVWNSRPGMSEVAAVCTIFGYNILREQDHDHIEAAVLP